MLSIAQYTPTMVTPAAAEMDSWPQAAWVNDCLFADHHWNHWCKTHWQLVCHMVKCSAPLPPTFSPGPYTATWVGMLSLQERLMKTNNVADCCEGKSPGGLVCSGVNFSADGLQERFPDNSHLHRNKRFLTVKATMSQQRSRAFHFYRRMPRSWRACHSTDSCAAHLCTQWEGRGTAARLW